METMNFQGVRGTSRNETKRNLTLNRFELTVQVVAFVRDNCVRMHKTHAHLPLIADWDIAAFMSWCRTNYLSEKRNYRRRLRAIKDLDIRSSTIITLYLASI